MPHARIPARAKESRYKADITAGALKVPESRIVADLLLQESDEAGWKDAILRQNILQARNSATTPMAALDEALAYLVQNTFTKMGYLKKLQAEPLKELQAILRSDDIGQQTLALQTEEGNKPAIDDLRDYLRLSASTNRQIVLHDMIEKRYAIRPYGWPDEEVLILVARLLVLGEINLMMDGA